jgi:hypothetical protein
MIELENLTRTVFHFPVYERGPAPENRPKARGALREVRRIKLGDVADRQLPDGHARDDRFTPAPVVRLTDEQYKALGERNLKLIDALVKRGDIVKRELAA